MKLRELVNEVIIDSRKLTDYALDPENPKGKDKAAMFARYLGYTKDNYQSLLDQIYGREAMQKLFPKMKTSLG